jgi:hypothetical protein
MAGEAPFMSPGSEYGGLSKDKCLYACTCQVLIKTELNFSLTFRKDVQAREEG